MNRLSCSFLALLFVLQVNAFGWAVLLNSPSLIYQEGMDGERIEAVRAELTRLDFDNGYIHVSSPNPTRTMRFAAPGQEVNTLVALLTELGFSVTITFTDDAAGQEGFTLQQPDAELTALTIVINSAHRDYDPMKMRLEFRSSATTS